MDKIMEFLPFLIPLVIAEFALLGYTLHHILTHKNYKRGNRTLWLIITIVLMNFVGPIRDGGNCCCLLEIHPKRYSFRIKKPLQFSSLVGWKLQRFF